jgi:hypothetical protein
MSVYIVPTDGLPETEQRSAFAVAEKAKMSDPGQIPRDPNVGCGG